MRTPICDLLGIDLPLLAFSHCRDVVAAVTNAGGFGVLGASMHTPEQLEQELAWVDKQVGGRPYGADILVPEKFAGKGQSLDSAAIRAMVGQPQRDFVAELLARHGIARGDGGEVADVTISDAAGERLLEVAFRHPIKLIASALGTPPASMIERAHAARVPIAALVGSREHAIRQVNAGVDILVASGTEAGGHCGEVTTMVLVPEVIEAIAPIRPVPVLAAGGIVTGRQMAAAIALGADGAWTGSVWLTTEEAETAPYTKERMLAATSRDTVRSTSRTGKPSRQLRSAWTAAWDGPDSPGALPMPLQSLLAEPALRRIDVLAEQGDRGARDLATYWVGQGVGLMNKVRPAREVVYEMASDFAAAAERLAGVLGELARRAETVGGTWNAAGMSDAELLQDLDLAIAAADTVVAGIGPGQWSAPTPCTDLNVRELLNHMVSGNVLFAALASGGPTPDRSADHLGADPLGAFRSAGQALRQAFAAPGMLAQTYTAPFGTAPGIALVQVRVVEMLVHGWDLAKGTGQAAVLPEDVAERALAASKGQLSGARTRPGAPFGPEVPVAADASAIDRLVVYLGRRP